MPTKKQENDEERFARIDALMEEYRVNHDDLEAYVQAMRDRTERQGAHARELRHRTELRIVDARRRLVKTRKR